MMWSRAVSAASAPNGSAMAPRGPCDSTGLMRASVAPCRRATCSDKWRTVGIAALALALLNVGRIYRLPSQPRMRLDELSGFGRRHHVDVGKVATGIGSRVLAKPRRHGVDALRFTVAQEGAEAAQVAAREPRQPFGLRAGWERGRLTRPRHTWDG